MSAQSEYTFKSAGAPHSAGYLWPAVRRLIEETRARRLFEIGCGNGTTARQATSLGIEVVGIDPSESGITNARQNCPQARLDLGSAYDDLAGKYGRFPLVVSLEVVEHCFFPRKFATTAFDLLEPGGTLILSTPFHGYWKNLALAITGKMDQHFTALWDYGHIKFWSENTLRALLSEAGFTEVRFVRVGRISPLAKSMIAIARRPS